MLGSKKMKICVLLFVHLLESKTTPSHNKMEEQVKTIDALFKKMNIRRLVGPGRPTQNFDQFSYYSTPGSLLRDMIIQIVYTYRCAHGPGSADDVSVIMAYCLKLLPHWKGLHAIFFEEDLRAVLLDDDPVPKKANSGVSWEDIRKLIQYDGPGFQDPKEFTQYCKDLAAESEYESEYESDYNDSDYNDKMKPMAIAVEVDQQGPIVTTSTTNYYWTRVCALLLLLLLGIALATVAFQVLVCRTMPLSDTSVSDALAP